MDTDKNTILIIVMVAIVIIIIFYFLNYKVSCSGITHGYGESYCESCQNQANNCCAKCQGHPLGGLCMDKCLDSFSSCGSKSPNGCSANFPTTCR